MQQGAPPAREQAVEEASPIRSRPPAANLEELMRFSTEEGVSGGGLTGNRWPREETLALLRIRSEMDVMFRDAAVKGPLWEDVSRKLAELGYKRSAKKCKEKFENVHKYHKRTKEGRSGRQHGKTYKFFTQLEALNTTATPPPYAAATAAETLNVTPLSVGITPPSDPIDFSSNRIFTNPTPASSQPISVLGIPTPSSYGQFPTTTAVSFGFTTPTAAVVPPASSYGITFSSHSSSTASRSGFDDDEMEDIPEPSNAAGMSRKRKRQRSKRRGGGSRMMELFENLMRKVMEKQDSMQRSFLETIDRKDRERLYREEAWRRQESARLARENELMAHERSTSAARDAAIVSLIQRFTGHTTHFPSLEPQSAATAATTPPTDQPISSPLQQSTNVPAIPEQRIASPSSRWPKSEIIALINLRSGLESKYQEAGIKAPLWEEISAEMKRIGYNRNAKRCKEKWENINKYYKKVKENSSKKRPEDAKTCPYFHQLDALYRNKIIGGGTTGEITPRREQISLQISNRLMESVTTDARPIANRGEETVGVAAQTLGFGRNGSKIGEEESGKKPEDLVRVLMEQQGRTIQQEQQPLTMVDYDKIDEPHSYNLNHDEDEPDDDEDEDGKRGFKIEFQQSNTTNTPNREGNNGATSFFTMVQ